MNSCVSILPPSRYELPQYGSRRKLISPAGLYDEYGEVVVDDDGSYYYSPQESDAEVNTEQLCKTRKQTVTNTRGHYLHPQCDRREWNRLVLHSILTTGKTVHPKLSPGKKLGGGPAK